MRYARITPPETPQVSVEDVKRHLRVDHSDDEDYLDQIVAAATDYLDGRSGVLGRCLGYQTWRLDCQGPSATGVLPIDLPPVQSITKIEAIFEGTLSEWPSNRWLLQFDGERAFAVPAEGFAWPPRDRRTDALQVTFVSGYEGGAPAPVRQAILLLAGLLYENREGAPSAKMDELPFGISALIAPYRVIR